MINATTQPGGRAPSRLEPARETPGSTSDGNTLAREPLTARCSTTPTGAFPNLLESDHHQGQLAYVPNTCSSPNGPFRFNVNVQSCLSTIDTEQNTEAFATAQHERGRARSSRSA